MRYLRITLHDDFALSAAAWWATSNANAHGFVDFISEIITLGTGARNWPEVEKMTGGK
jgi:hypothetical protein